MAGPRGMDGIPDAKISAWQPRELNAARVRKHTVSGAAKPTAEKVYRDSRPDVFGAPPTRKGQSQSVEQQTDFDLLKVERRLATRRNSAHLVTESGDKKTYNGSWRSTDSSSGELVLPTSAKKST